MVALLADDRLGATRERPEALGPYLAAFDAMADDPMNRLIVGETQGRIVATYHLTLIAGLTLGATLRAQIEGVRVASDLRGQGLGRALIADAEARAREAGAGLLQLTMNAGRADAARFYAARGFVASHTGFKKPLD